LPIPLAIEPRTLRVPLRDLKKEVCLIEPESIFQLAVTVVEQERGLELQTSFPESTLAARFPVVNAIESPNALNNEFFSPGFEAALSEPLRDRKKENLSPRVKTRAIEALKDLRNEVCSTKLETEVRALLRDLKSEDFATKLEPKPRLVVRALTKVVFSAEDIPHPPTGHAKSV
jgi:hypothetical protein